MSGSICGGKGNLMNSEQDYLIRFVILTLSNLVIRKKGKNERGKDRKGDR